MEQILACGRNYVRKRDAARWRWIDMYGEPFESDPSNPSPAKTEEVILYYCGQRNVNNVSYRLICDKCQTRHGFEW